MPIVTPDFENNRPKLVPGPYRARILSCEQKTSKQGASYLNWKLETIDGGHRNWVYLSTTLNGKGAEMLKKLVQCTINSTYGFGAVNTDEMIGKTLIVHVDRNYNQDGSESPFPRVVDLERDPVTDDIEF